jgi:NADPH-dependent curcumin reductase CurA
MTSHQGLRDIGQVKPGETLVVSGAAGSVGSIACQLGKRAGAKVYAIAGSQDKCEWLENELGVDKAFNYKSPTFREDIKKIGYIDVFFDNVGGMVSYAITITS